MNYIMLSPLSLVLSNNILLRVSEEDEVPLLVASYEAQGNVERIRPPATGDFHQIALEAFRAFRLL